LSVFGKILGAIGWLALGSVLTMLFFVPFWLAVGTMFYPHTHPDLWRGPATFLPPLLSCLVASLLVVLIAARARKP
jgi:hypothetical protein